VTSSPEERAPKRRRWGLWTLGFIILAVVALVTAQLQGYHSLGTFGCLILGIAGAVYCSIRGWKSMISLEWATRR